MFTIGQIIYNIIILLILIIIFIFWIIWSDIIGAGFEPTSWKLVKRMLEMAGVDSHDIVYDLGSGDGRIVIESARIFNAHSVGIEADPLRYFWSKIKVSILGLQSQVSIVWGNFHKQDLSKATVVTLFLSDKANQKLKQKLQQELDPGTRVISYFWRFKGWKPVLTDEKNHIYLYIIGKTSETLIKKNNITVQRKGILG